MQVIEVLTNRQRKEFLDFPKRLYKKDPFWIAPLDSSIEALFNPEKNHSFEHGIAIRWILRDDTGKTIGRVAGFIDRIRSGANSQPTGGLGFFEVVEDKEAAFVLFNTAKDWLAANGIQAMDGYGMPYNMKYYQKFFEEYGFRNYFEQYSYHRTVRGADKKIDRFPNRIMKIAEWLSRRPGYSFRHFEFRNSLKYINDICEIYNTTWVYLKEDFTPLEPKILNEALQNAKFVIDEELIWFAYYNDKPIGFFVLLPDFNQILRHFNGKLQPWNIIRFIYYKLTHEMTRMRAVVGGVLRSHQNTGIESAIFYHLYQVFEHKPWLKELELSWVGDYNPKMLAIYEALGATRAKTHVTYRYMINKDLKFIRYKDETPVIQDIKTEGDKKSQ
jgi:GNAT superfamily N-acetyltransferase